MGPPTLPAPQLKCVLLGQVSLERQLDDSLALLSSYLTKPIEDTQDPTDLAKGLMWPAWEKVKEPLTVEVR